MKVYNKVVISMKTGEVLDEDSFEYNGPVSEAKGGGTQTVDQEPWEAQQPFLKKAFDEAANLYVGTRNVTGYQQELNPLYSQWETKKNDLYKQYLNQGYTDPLTGDMVRGDATWAMNQANKSAGSAPDQYLQKPIYGSQVVGGAQPYYKGDVVANWSDLENQYYDMMPQIVLNGGSNVYQAGVKAGGMGWYLNENGVPTVNINGSVQAAQPGVNQAYNYLPGFLQSNLQTLNNPGLAAGQGAYNTAFPQWQKTVQGQYLNPATNPYLASTYQSAVDKALGTVNSNASMAGAYGGSSYQDLVGQTAGNIATQLYGQNYQTERDRQLQALGMGGNMVDLLQNPYLANEQLQLSAAGQYQDYLNGAQSALLQGNTAQANADLQKWQSQISNWNAMSQLGLQYDQSFWSNQADRFLKAGEAQRQMSQEEINAAMNEWQWNLNEPWDRLQKAMGIVKGDYGYSTQTPTYSPSPVSGLLSGGMAGLGAAGSLGLLGAANMWNPAGWAMVGGGALAGVLGGM